MNYFWMSCLLGMIVPSSEQETGITAATQQAAVRQADRGVQSELPGPEDGRSWCRARLDSMCWATQHTNLPPLGSCHHYYHHCHHHHHHHYHCYHQHHEQQAPSNPRFLKRYVYLVFYHSVSRHHWALSQFIWGHPSTLGGVRTPTGVVGGGWLQRRE